MRKTATLVAMLRVLTQQDTDDTLDVFDARGRENLLRRAERESAKSDQSLGSDAVWAALETAVGQASLTEALVDDELTVDQGDPEAAARAEVEPGVCGGSFTANAVSCTSPIATAEKISSARSAWC